MKNAKVISKASKINKIKKMDFNFDFDSFNDVNFSDFTEKDQDNNKENKNNEENDDNEQKEKEKEKELEKEEGYHKSYSNSKVSDEEFLNMVGKNEITLAYLEKRGKAEENTVRTDWRIPDHERTNARTGSS